ncbi:MAG: hypothetical protein RL670_480 [Actinomycetota bacterium]
MNKTQLVAAANDWLEQDPDPITRAELRELVQTKNYDELADRFEGRLSFGTAGLRGELGAGPNRMNRLVVAQTAAGIALWMKEHSETLIPTVVIGYDGRINSQTFAHDSAAIFTAAGVRALVFDRPIPTPTLAFAVREHGYSLGVMVTASHNPPRDNGYKVYLGGKGGGAQIVAPADKQMAKAIDKIAAEVRYDQIPKADAYETGGQIILEEYLAACAALLPDTPAGKLKVVYTAMHGVGWESTQRLFARAHLPELIPVTRQTEPDGKFPTVEFPNPEEPGALDLAVVKATEVGADLIIAHDPDADRLAVVVPDSQTSSGWRTLTGDQVGLLLGHEIATKAKAEKVKGTLATTIVSSSALAEVAAAHKLKFVETPTGFKNLARIPKLLFAYEEALGYSVNPSKVPDKDGVSAALMVVALANRLSSEGLTLNDQLSKLAERYGHFATGQVTIRFAKASQASSLMNRLRKTQPKKLDGVSVAVEDLLTPTAGLPAIDALRMQLADGRRVIIRPSGTEPKLKCYLQCKADSADLAEAGLKSLSAAVEALLKK